MIIRSDGLGRMLLYKTIQAVFAKQEGFMHCYCKLFSLPNFSIYPLPDNCNTLKCTEQEKLTPPSGRKLPFLYF